MTQHVVVIGGGVIGLTTAYQLATDGARVTLVDARQTGTVTRVVVTEVRPS